MAELDHVVTEFVRHLIPPPPETPPSSQALAAVLRLLRPEVQRRVAKAIMNYDRMPKANAKALAKAVGAELGLASLEEPAPAQHALSPEEERKQAWAKIKELIASRTDAAAVASVIRDRLHAKYDADEIRQSWITLTECRPHVLDKNLLSVALRADGKTDPIAHTVMETYVTRLTHEKYAEHVSQGRQQPADHVPCEAGQPNPAQLCVPGEMGQPGSGDQALCRRRHAGISPLDQAPHEA